MNDDHPNPLPDDVANRLRGTFHAEHGAQIHRMETGTSAAPAASRWAFRRLLVPLVALLAAAGIGGGAVAVFSGDGESQTVQTELADTEAGTTQAELVEVPRAEPGVDTEDLPADAAAMLDPPVAVPIPTPGPATTPEEQAVRWFDAVVRPTAPLSPSCPEPFNSFVVSGQTAIAELCEVPPLFDDALGPQQAQDATQVGRSFSRAMAEVEGIEQGRVLRPGGQRCLGNRSNVNPLCFDPEALGGDEFITSREQDCAFLVDTGRHVNIARTSIEQYEYEPDWTVGAPAGIMLVKTAPGAIISGVWGTLEPETPVVLRHEPGWCVMLGRTSIWWKIPFDETNFGWIEAAALWEHGEPQGPEPSSNGLVQSPLAGCATTPEEDARVKSGLAPDTSGDGRLEVTGIEAHLLPECTQIVVELADIDGVGQNIFADRLSDGQVALIDNHVVFGGQVRTGSSTGLPGAARMLPQAMWVDRTTGSPARAMASLTSLDRGNGPLAAVKINGPEASVKVRVADNPARVIILVSPAENASMAPTTTPTPPPATAPPLTTECAEDQKQQQQRYDVVDVAPDDPDGGLLVHSEPGVNTPVIAVLPWNAAAVPSFSGCMVVNGSPWWRAPGRSISSNASGGWVNARYLGTHRSPQDDLSTVPCDAGPAATSLPNATDGQLDVTPRESSLDRVQLGAAGQDGFRIESTNDCHRLVIPLTEIQGVDIPDYFDIHTMRLEQVPVNQFAVVANSGGTLDIAVGTGISPVEESSTQGQWVGKTWTDTSTGRELGAFYTGAVGVEGSSGTLRVLYGSGQASVRTADNPARLIVDITPFPDPVGQRSGPIVGAGTVLYEPLQRDLEGPGVESSITVRGYGHGFEGTLVVEVLPWDGVSSPTEVLDQRDAGLLSPVVDAVQVTTAAGTKATSDTDGVFILDANGEFSFDLDFFAPGSAWQIMVEASNPAPDESGLGHLRFLGAGQQIRVADPSVPAEGQRYPEAVAFGTLANADS